MNVCSSLPGQIYIYLKQLVDQAPPIGSCLQERKGDGGKRGSIGEKGKRE